MRSSGSDALLEGQPALRLPDILGKPADPAHQADDRPDAWKGASSVLPRLA
jgi:hypothetical protein